MHPSNSTVVRAPESVLATNKVLRNTYILLSLTLLFSAAVAGLAMTMGWPHPGMLLTLGGFFGLMMLTNSLRNSAWGILAVFAFTGFMGYTIGPIISMYTTMLPNGTEVVMTALGGTGAIFIALSAYALTSRKDFSFMAGFLMTGILVAFLAGLGAFFFNMPMLSLGVSAMFIMLMSGMILFETSRIIHGGETNYISATVTLYVALYNLFLSLLHILGAMGRD